MLLDRNNSLLLLIDVQEKLTPLVCAPDKLVSKCEWLLRLAERMNVPFLVSEQYPKGLGATVAPLKPYCRKTNCIEKIHFSCMQEVRYLDALKQHKKNQLIITGIEAHVCVLQTVMEMRALSYDVYVVVDAVSSRHELDIKYALKRMKQEGAHLVTSEMVFFEWIRQAGTPEFKALSKEFLQ